MYNNCKYEVDMITSSVAMTDTILLDIVEDWLAIYIYIYLLSTKSLVNLSKKAY